MTQPNSPQYLSSPFWRYLLNLKVFNLSFVVWVSLICQDFYAFIFEWSTYFQVTKYFYLIKWVITLLLVYSLFLLLNFLINLPTFKHLFHKKIFLIVLVIWSVMNLSCYQLLFFDYVPIISVYVLKLFHLFALYSLVLIITNFIRHRHESKVKHQLILIGIFCAIGWLFLLLTYPGTWSCDDIRILNASAYYDLFPWQHIFTATFYILCLQTIPFVFSVIFFQVFINALIFSYCITTLADIFTKTLRQKLILEIILSILFIFPPVLFHTLGGFRMGIYQFLELYLLTRLIALYHFKNNKLSLLNLIDITVLTIIVGTWRTECLFYPVIVLLVLFFLGKERIKRTTAVIMAITSLIGIFAINSYNTKLIGNDNYSLYNTYQYIVPIIRNVEQLNEEDLTILNQVIDVDSIKFGATDNPVFYTHYGWTLRGDYTQDELSAYYTTVAKLILQNSNTAFSNIFYNFSQILTPKENISFPFYDSIVSFTDPDWGTYFINMDHIKNSYLYKPINASLRNQLIQNFNGFNDDFTPSAIYRMFYNLAIPLILFFVAIIIILICRQWFLLIPITAILLHMLVVIFTAPDCIFFYYLSIYLIMFIFSTVIIWNGIAKLIEKIRLKKNMSQLKA